MKKIINFFKEEDGAAIPEYALILGLITVAAVLSIGALSDQVNTTIDTVTDAITPEP